MQEHRALVTGVAFQKCFRDTGVSLQENGWTVIGLEQETGIEKRTLFNYFFIHPPSFSLPRPFPSIVFNDGFSKLLLRTLLNLSKPVKD